MKNPYLQLQAHGLPELAELGWHSLKNSIHGDLPHWLGSIDALPEGDGYTQLNREAPVIGRPVAEASQLRQNLLNLHPWRKGPLELGGVKIDTEWRSDWKWDRLKPHLDLNGHRILDIGCGNGYFGLRMLAAGAQLVVGIDPTLVFVMQWLAMQKLGPGLNNFVLPLAIEDLPIDTPGFDSVFSMGVLYHRRKPVEHLEQLKKLTRPGGQIILETLVLEGEGREVLKPAGRYARMRNVHAIPKLEVLHDWLEQAGLNDVQVLDVSRTTTDEQRSTDWMTFESLGECLDVNNPSITVEGHPAPTRAALLVKKPLIYSERSRL
ncbi:MAG: tRNA 5-methoxyuridine(34)/uridine 5-oxyacetic acid(34) synthase CmoB [Xanthomonadales bacterium]|nr:tRNA 5-methoxyuridine(34)/uridine 5-oxyacetic acid(34) synthase CmoB [Xanthomonadales bacterium]